ncbi:MAG: 16S rRNA (guanine(527)-N(7))-methyltransferase RsmG [Marinilabiliales bacterium]|nr:16S rRNA (guanine(527)-N(7))-methyltransferase RsmG [Marinilabiliales bacterium]
METHPELEILLKYFPNLSADQCHQFEMLGPLYHEWNGKINVISRKDIGELYVRHILHSLAVARIIHFKPGTTLLDVGTGGGFPGIPLAILFPDCRFHLIDSIGKKIRVVEEVAKAIRLNNVSASQTRVEDIREKYDFIISRAVTAFPDFVKMVRKNVSAQSKNALPNGILYLKGGDFGDELLPFRSTAELFDLSGIFPESFFETKKLIFLPIR